MVAHAGAGDDPGVRQLHRAAQPLQGAGGQGVHHDDAGGLQPPGQGLGHQAALHAGGGQHPGGGGGHRAQVPEVLRHLLHQMAGDQQVVHRQGADEVGGHGPVAQADDQGRAVLGQQGAQALRHRRHRPGKGPLLPAEQAVQLHGDIYALGLAQRPGPLGAGDGDGVHRKALPDALLRPDAGEGRPRPGALPPELVGLHRQISAPLCHKRFPLIPDVVAAGPVCSYFLPGESFYAKN